MENIDGVTNDYFLYKGVGLDQGNFALWVLSTMEKSIGIDQLVRNVFKKTCPTKFDKVFLVSFEGDLWALRNWLPDNVYCWDSVIYDYPVERHYTFLFWADYLVSVNRQIDSLARLVDPLHNNPSQIFDCLLGINRPHREFIAEQINLSTFKNKIIFNYFKHNQSWLPGGNHDSLDPLSLSLGSHDNNEFSVRLENCNNSQYFVKFHNDCRATLSLLVPWKIYNDSWFSIVADTIYSYDPEKFFPELNEKIFKPIFAKRLFVYFGSAYSLKRLKSQGFQTFGQVIDESYDNCIDDHQRWSMAWQQVEFLASQDPTQIYKKILPVLEHNQQLILTTDFRQNLANEIKTIAGI